MVIDDGELATWCKQGDRIACDELVRRHWDVMYRVAFAIVGHADQAQDVVQEAFVRAYRALGHFDETLSFGAWLKQIVVNRAISAIAREERRSDAASEQLPDTVSPNPTDALIADQLRAAVRQAITELPQQQRIAIRLLALEDMDLAEVAELMGCAATTMRTHLYRARRRLKESLADYLEEEQDSEL